MLGLKLRYSDDTYGWHGEIWSERIRLREEIATVRRMERTLAKLDPVEDEWLYRIGREELEGLIGEVQKGVDEVEHHACHCDKCGGWSDPDYFGGYPCNCP